MHVHFAAFDLQPHPVHFLMKTPHLLSMIPNLLAMGIGNTAVVSPKVPLFLRFQTNRPSNALAPTNLLYLLGRTPKKDGETSR